MIAGTTYACVSLARVPPVPLCGNRSFRTCGCLWFFYACISLARVPPVPVGVGMVRDMPLLLVRDQGLRQIGQEGPLPNPGDRCLDICDVVCRQREAAVGIELAAWLEGLCQTFPVCLAAVARGRSTILATRHRGLWLPS